MRAGENVKQTNHNIIISFIPSSRKEGLAVDYYWGTRDNPYYVDRAYGQYEKVYIRAYSITAEDVNGRIICDYWLDVIEKYIRNKWNILLLGIGSINEETFDPYREIYSDESEPWFGKELSFDVITTTSWSNEPVDTGLIKSPVLVTGIVIDKPKVWVKI